MRSDDEQRLSAYHDGELSPNEMEQMRLAVEADETLRAKLEGLRHLSAMMHLGSTASVAPDLDGEALFERISSSIDEPTATTERAISDEEISRHYDGELDESDRVAVRAAMACDLELAQKRDGLVHLTNLFAMHVEAVSREVDADALFARIEGALAEREDDADPMFPGQLLIEARPALRMIAGGRREAKPAAQKSARGMWVGVAGLVLAAAAVLGLLYMRPITTVEVPIDDMPGPLAVVVPLAGSEVEEVDFGYSTGAIFALEGQDGEPIAVVWISDEKLEDDSLEHNPLDENLPVEDDTRERVQ